MASVSGAAFLGSASNAGREDIQLHLARKANVSHEAPQLLADIQRLLHRSDADVDIDGALLHSFW